MSELMKKLLLVVLVGSLVGVNVFTVSAADPLADDINIGGVQRNADGSASVGDISSDQDDVKVGDDIRATDEGSNVGEIKGQGVGNDIEGSSAESSTKSNTAVNSEPNPDLNAAGPEATTTAVPSVTGNGNVERLPQTGPSEILLGIFSLFAAGLFFMRKRKNK